MARIVPRLVLLDGFGEEVGAPVCKAADDATVGEDEGAGCVGYSEGGRWRQYGKVDGFKESRDWGRQGRFYSLTSLVVCGLTTRTWLD